MYERNEMSQDIEIRDSTWELLDDVSEIKDKTVSALVDEILSDWLKKHYDEIIEKAELEENAEGDEGEEAEQ
jgi:predicted transcriptional regulator YdeE